MAKSLNLHSWWHVSLSGAAHSGPSFKGGPAAFRGGPQRSCGFRLSLGSGICGLVARGLQLNPDPFLMAVATGAGCDFLTPVGHQCNTLVMGPGGYRFGDYARLGAPLSIMVIVAGAPLIALFWPLTSH